MIELGTGFAHSSAAPDAFFDRWIDHATWSEWSPDTRWVRLDGPVEVGTRGRLKPMGGPAVGFVITACVRPSEYTDTSHLIGARLVFRHTAAPVGDGTDLGVRVTITGPLARLWASTMGRSFRTSAQADLDRLVAVVEAAT